MCRRRRRAPQRPAVAWRCGVVVVVLRVSARARVLRVVVVTMVSVRLVVDVMVIEVVATVVAVVVVVATQQQGRLRRGVVMLISVRGQASSSVRVLLFGSVISTQGPELPCWR